MSDDEIFTVLMMDISTCKSNCDFSLYEVCCYGMSTIFIDILSIDVMCVVHIPNFVLKPAENNFIVILIQQTAN